MRGQRFQINIVLAPKSSADFHGCDGDLGDRQVQDAGHLFASGVAALGAAPYLHMTVVTPQRRRRVGFDVALVDGLRQEFALHHHVGLGETGLHVAAQGLGMDGNVGGVITHLTQFIRAQVFVQNGRILLHGLAYSSGHGAGPRTRPESA